MRQELFDRLASALAEEELVAVATVLSGPLAGRQRLLPARGDAVGELGSAALAGRAGELAAAAFRDFACRRETLTVDGEESELFVDVHPPPPRLIVVGAVHAAIPLIRFARILGFHTVIIDPRGAFATAERFADADRLLVDWPAEALAEVGLNENSYVAVLSHDLKIDLPALEIAVRSPARYVGALGSRKTHAKRVAALEASGFSAEEIGRIRSPIGVDLGGGRRAEEIALSVIAEVVSASHGR